MDLQGAHQMTPATISTRIYHVYEEDFRQQLDQDHGGVMSTVSWDQLQPHLERACKLRNGERLVGAEATPDGIRCTFTRAK